MLVRFWGTRGSLPVALSAAEVRAKVKRALILSAGEQLDSEEKVERFIGRSLDFPTTHTFGGNTSCVEIEPGGGEFVLCDLGSGLRAFSQRLMEHRGPGPFTFNVFLSHVHWDHIMGFPFFTQAYVPGNKVRIHGSHDVMEEALRGQNSRPCFPVPFETMGADIEFVHLEPDRSYEIAGLTVRNSLQNHGGDSYGYRFEQDGRSVIYSTDAEHKLDEASDIEGAIEFFRDADLVIFDSMYSLADSVSVKEDWGHSSNIVGVDLCHRAAVKHYCMFHHEPIYDDNLIYQVLNETIRYEEITREGEPLKVSSAYDGLEIEV